MTLLPYLFLAAGLIGFLGLFYDISGRLRRLRNRVGTCEGRIQLDVVDLVSGLNSLKRRLEDLETNPPASGVPGLTGTSMNSTLRSKVLKMSRLGHSPERIADTLRLSRGEVNLLVKVHCIVMRPYEGVMQPQTGER